MNTNPHVKHIKDSTYGQSPVSNAHIMLLGLSQMINSGIGVDGRRCAYNL